MTEAYPGLGAGLGYGLLLLLVDEVDVVVLAVVPGGLVDVGGQRWLLDDEEEAEPEAEEAEMATAAAAAAAAVAANRANDGSLSCGVPQRDGSCCDGLGDAGGNLLP